MAKTFDRPGIHEQCPRESIQFPIIPESALRGTLGTLARNVALGEHRPIL